MVNGLEKLKCKDLGIILLIIKGNVRFCGAIGIAVNRMTNGGFFCGTHWSDYYCCNMQFRKFGILKMGFRVVLDPNKQSRSCNFF